MPTSIIVPLDGSPRAEAALAPAQALAEGLGAAIVLVQAVDAGETRVAQQYLDGVAGRLGPSGVNTLVVNGSAAAEIVSVVHSHSGSVVCMTSHGHTGVGAALLGSVAEAVVQQARRPIVLIGPSLRSPPEPLDGGPIVFAYDGSDASASLEPLVTEWAKQLGLPVRVVMVLHRDGEFIGNYDSTQARQLAKSLTDRLSGEIDDVRLDFLDGIEPARVIADYAKNERAALVAVATHGHGLAHVLLGSVATRVGKHADCPVIVLRPTDKS